MKAHLSKAKDSSSNENADQSYFARKNQASLKSPHFFQPSLVQTKLKEAQNSTAEGLDKETKPELEKFFNFNFDGVKIHDNPASHEASNLIQAKAYTTGNHIFFGREAKDMSPIQRKLLLAHEAVHTIQQKTFSPNLLQTKPIIGAPDTNQEMEADNFANAFMLSQKEGYRSTALQMRSNLRISPVSHPSIQRSVKTWGGEWDIPKYNLVTPPITTGLRGVDIELTFDPGTNVDAQLIGLTQSYRSIKNKKPYFINADKFYEDRSIKSGDAITIDNATTETDQGSMIDRLKDYNNPIYPVKSQPSATLDDPNTSPDWGQHGYHYTDKSGIKHKKAKLLDEPKLNNAEKNSGQIFETTALATKGNQTGTYYGSVRWGWRTDDKGKFSKLPLEAVSEGVPSSTFMKSAEIWNTSKSSTGADTVDLPIVDVKVTTRNISQVMDPGQMGPPITIPSGTRVQIVTPWHPPLLNGEVKVVDGPFTGMFVLVSAEDLASLRDERS